MVDQWPAIAPGFKPEAIARNVLALKWPRDFRRAAAKIICISFLFRYTRTNHAMKIDAAEGVKGPVTGKLQSGGPTRTNKPGQFFGRSFLRHAAAKACFSANPTNRFNPLTFAKFCRNLPV
jgi:hypothetical protein